ncbi:GntR family transcriptional regulator [Haematobacter missouriensis]|uniref:GntR family transcriptional regulator n=1 Tax=Haematobacter missouriensis TaxID=366616 RepID=A0A212AKT5_9RHOB|nr:GntR family transcriptional regulator [Haematobacter missouriensis]KFI33497.1 GntR family transcriptional regulator [Haematobacter missouriensis]OWJ71919.1 GntR family transcriptional regulator [Haematobacter missouriensis]OWJ82079.1 GntR family transcriptional regulator [Haematobacter missouriensis]
MGEPLDTVENSTDQATRLIREAILSGQIGPGERLKTAELAHRLGFSTMPLREALRKLEGEGLVEIEPNRGATVRRLNRAYITDLFELNTDLRICAVRRGMASLTLERIRALEKLAQDYRGHIEGHEDLEAIRVNRDFNARLVEYGGNREALRVFLHGWDIIFAFRRSYGYGAGRRRVMADEMQMLIDALRRHDSVAAEAILRMQNAAMMEDLVSRIAPEG